MYCLSANMGGVFHVMMRVLRVLRVLLTTLATCDTGPIWKHQHHFKNPNGCLAVGCTGCAGGQDEVGGEGRVGIVWRRKLVRSSKSGRHERGQWTGQVRGYEEEYACNENTCNEDTCNEDTSRVLVTRVLVTRVLTVKPSSVSRPLSASVASITPFRCNIPGCSARCSALVVGQEINPRDPTKISNHSQQPQPTATKENV
jgi:hypothetical protein